METARKEQAGDASLACLIAAQPFASGLGSAALARLTETTACRRLGAGQFLFRQHATATRFFVVVEGRFKLYRISAAGDEKVIRRVGPGDSIAEGVAFMVPPRYPVYAQALEAGRVAGLSREIYRELLLACPETCLAVMGQFTDRIQQLLDEIENLTLHDGRDRVIRFLLELLPGADRDTTITLPARKNAIAAQLSIRPETLSRILGGLIRDGLVQRTAIPGQLRIPAPEILRRGTT